MRAGVRELEVVPLGERAALDQAFARALRSCYRVHGVDAVAKSLPDAQRQQVQLVVVRDRHGALLGGARIHAHRGAAGFPAEGALTSFPRTHRRFAALAHDGSVELSAMWTAPDAKRTGIARLLAQASIACAIALGKRTALTFSHQHFEHVLFPIGMRPLPGVAPVAFPTPAYRSRVYVAELSSLRNATAGDRDLIREMASCFSAGMAALSFEQLAEIEHGRPNFTMRTTAAPIRRVAS
jgi:GNAT superfamily N-acetyltransferase